ncbi:MAG: PDZ domain-containing protein, partial [Clostridiales Family XIII bacterium]|nr:PDZ domain-containing protein [Clostridiales Family XIII bacterium]
MTLIIIAVFLAGATAGISFYGALYMGVPPFTFPFADAPKGAGSDVSSGSALEENVVALSSEDVSRIEQLGSYLKKNFYRPISEGAIQTGLLRGLFMSPGDPYTIYYTKEEFEHTMEKTHGELSGIGLTLFSNEEGFIEVVSVIEASPAYKSGILKGDLLLTVDGKEYSGERLTEAVEAAHGEPGTKVVVGISRDGRVKDYTITRSVFITPSVVHEIMENAAGDSIGYIKVTSFNDNTSSDFEAALKEVDGSGAKGVVVDVRDNAGGLVDKAVEMDDMLLDKGVICYAEDG